MILSAPGHTPGHQLLLVTLPGAGPILLSGGLWHLPANRADRVVPSFNWDREETLASMDRIEAIIADRGATVYLQHYAAQNDSIPHSPEVIR